MRFFLVIGLHPKIIRKVQGNPCPWCANLAGVYDYPCDSVVFKRHANCRCIVEYNPADGMGKIQNVHSREWRNFSKREEVEKNLNALKDKEESGKIEARKKIDDIISFPIERGSKGNPSAISHFDVDLNKRQRKLLNQLPTYGSRVLVSKSSVSMTDLSALTAKTGDEFAMFTKRDKRLVVRGSPVDTPITVEDAKKMSADGYTWSGHTHPGTGDNVKAASNGDYAILEAFNQKTSVIYDSLGRYRTFEVRKNEKEKNQ